MGIRELRTFVAVAERGSLSAGADALSLSVPAVSAQIANLEQEMAVVLFDRSRKPAQLTGPGQLLLTKAREVLALYEQLGDALADRSDLAGSFVLGSIPTALTSVIRGGAGFIAGGDYRRVGGRWGSAIWTSPDGATWRRVASFSPTGGARWIVRTPGGFVAVGPPSRAFDSRDGISWSSASPYRMPVPDNILGRSWDVRDAAGSGSSVVIVGTYSESDGVSSAVGTSPIEHGGLVWRGAPF